MMKEFDRLLEAQRYQQANGDDRNVDEKALLRMHGFVRRVYVQHGFPVLLVPFHSCRVAYAPLIFS